MVRLTERCQAGLVGRAGEVEMLSEKCQLGLLSRVGEVERLTERRLVLLLLIEHMNTIRRRINDQKLIHFNLFGMRMPYQLMNS